jgi:rhamnosyltransferase
LHNAVSLIRKKSLDAYSSDVLAFWEDGREEVIVKSQPQKQFDFIFEAAGPGCTYVLTTGSLVKFKEFLVANSAADDFKLHDWLIYAFYRKQGLKWLIDDKPLMRYRQHANNQVGFNKGWKAYKTRIAQVRDKRYRAEVEKLLDLLSCPDGFKFSRSFLIFNFSKLRRRARDAYVLLAFNILGWF